MCASDKEVVEPDDSSNHCVWTLIRDTMTLKQSLGSFTRLLPITEYSVTLLSL